MGSPPTAAGASREAFDRAAAAYDATFEALPGTAGLRKIIGEVLLSCFRPGESILELNAGTGTDAILLASHGIRVHATDLSPEMVSTLRHKVAAHHLEHLVSSQILAFDQLFQIKDRVYDGVLSNMGGLNCIRDVSALGRDLAPLVRAGGYVVLGFMPDFSLWESTAFLLRGRWKDAFRRRRREGCLANVHGIGVPTYYHAPAAVRAAWGLSFDHVSTIGLNIFGPLPSSERAHAVLGAAARVLETFDAAVCRIPPFNRLGDHCLLVLRRHPLPPGDAA